MTYDNIKQVFSGLEDVDKQLNGTDAARFEFADGPTEGLDFISQRNVFPWGNDQPNDEGIRQDCVQ